MSSLSRADATTLAKLLPACLEREHRLLPALERLGVSASELRVLEADQHLLRILAEESGQQSAEASRRELQTVLAWHQRRLERVVGEAGHRHRHSRCNEAQHGHQS